MKKEELKTIILNKKLPTHIAIILDGNGRWAKKRLMPRTFGHQKGAKTLQEIIRISSSLGIKYLTVFAFSTENWSRPLEEVNFIMKEVKNLCKDYQKLINRNIKFKMIGSKEELAPDVRESIETMENKTANCDGMTFLLAFNYGAKQEIVNATKKICVQVKNNNLTINEIDETIFEKNLYTKDIPPVDLLIRTSGEMRISNFLLWQIAYAEIIFTKVYWPDFHEKEFYEAIYEYLGRNRRFGGLEKSE